MRSTFVLFAAGALVIGCGKDEPSQARPDGAGIREAPLIPVGLDGYRLWHRLPYLRIGARAYMRSTYDRAGNNETADASHSLM